MSLKILQLQADGSLVEVIIPVNAGAMASNSVIITDASGNIIASGLPSSKLGYLSNVTSDIQSQINSLSPAGLVTKSFAIGMAIALG